MNEILAARGIVDTLILGLTVGWLVGLTFGVLVTRWAMLPWLRRGPREQNTDVATAGRTHD
jgi:hypothetical protein